VVGQDETESGLRTILNFGHTIGHAIEAIAGYGRYLHGEALAIGEVAAARLSALQLGLSAGEVDRIARLLQAAGLPTTLKLTAAQKEQLFAAMRLDKKVSGGEIKFVLARQIGRVVWGQPAPRPQVEQALGWGAAPDYTSLPSPLKVGRDRRARRSDRPAVGPYHGK
jgi:3-dehydroquinate synthase